MDKVEDELEFHRRDGILRWSSASSGAAWSSLNCVQFPVVDGPLFIERGDPHPHHGSGPIHPLRKWDRVRELKPTVGDFSGGIVLVRRCQDSELAVAKVMKPITSWCGRVNTGCMKFE